MTYKFIGSLLGGLGWMLNGFFGKLSFTEIVDFDSSVLEIVAQFFYHKIVEKYLDLKN